MSNKTRICPLYKAAVLASGKTDDDMAMRTSQEAAITCDEGKCGAWNPVTGTCGLNNYSVTPLLNER